MSVLYLIADFRVNQINPIDIFEIVDEGKTGKGKTILIFTERSISYY